MNNPLDRSYHALAVVSVKHIVLDINKHIAVDIL